MEVKRISKVCSPESGTVIKYAVEGAAWAVPVMLSGLVVMPTTVPLVA